MSILFRLMLLLHAAWSPSPAFFPRADPDTGLAYLCAADQASLLVGGRVVSSTKPGEMIIYYRPGIESSGRLSITVVVEVCE